MNIIKGLIKSAIAGMIAMGSLVVIFIFAAMAEIFDVIEFIKKDPKTGIIVTLIMYIPIIIIIKLVNKGIDKRK